VSIGFDQMRRQLEDVGLCAPPVPDDLAPALTKRGEWFYASREMEPGRMYSPPRYAAEVVAAPVEDYVALCHIGHGIASYEIVYHLVYGQLALFTGTSWGGVYVDKEESSATVRKQFRRCAELLAAFQAARDQLPPLPRRLIVVEEELSGLSVCKWLNRPVGSETAAVRWLQRCEREEEGAVAAAVKLLQRKPRPASK
jgi:hypothetical protein